MIQKFREGCVLKIFLFLYTMYSLNLHAQESPSRWIIKTNPLVYHLTRIYPVQLEKSTFKKQSIQIGFYYMNSTSFDLFSGGSITGYCITPEYRFYLSNKEVCRGMYFAPFYHYYNAKVNADPSDISPHNTVGNYKLISQGPGLLLGYQFTIINKISIDIFAGPAIYNAANTNFSSHYVIGWTSFPVGGLTGRIGFSCGYIF